MNKMEMKPVDKYSRLDLVYIKDGIPHCKKHGAMNKLTKSGLWRCFSEVSTQTDRCCNASCYYE